MTHTSRFTDKVALVTAGASGIGEATVRRLHAEGASVVVGDISGERCAQLGAELGDRYTSVACDVTRDADVKALVEHAAKTFGRLDCAFNVAGGGIGGGTLLNTTEEAWRLTVDLCLTSAFFSIRHEAEQMIAQGTGGAIVNVASMNARIPVYGVGAYCCAKAGMVMLTQVAALELGEHNIRVNVVSPGHTATPMTSRTPTAMREKYLEQTPLTRIGRPEDIAAALLFLASDDAHYVSGGDLLVDGAFCTTTHFDLRPYFPNVERSQ